jgi:valyl-tRNA synthetase
LLRLFAPVLPYVSEEIWSWCFAEEMSGADSSSSASSIHRAPWPSLADFEAIDPPAHPESFEIAVAAHAVINKAKADAEVSMGREVSSLCLAATATTFSIFEGVARDVLSAARVAEHAFETKAELEEGVFEVLSIEFAERAA